MSVPKQRGGVGMSGPLTLLRREPDRPTAIRWMLVLGCTVTALTALPPLVHAAAPRALQPDPPAGPLSNDLQPDAFPRSAAPVKAVPAAPPAAAAEVAPMRGAAGLPELSGPPAKPQITPPSVTTQPALVTAPVTPRPVRPNTIRAVTKHRPAARLHLPGIVSGTVELKVDRRATRRPQPRPPLPHRRPPRPDDATCAPPRSRCSPSWRRAPVSSRSRCGHCVRGWVCRLARRIIVLIAVLLSSLALLPSAEAAVSAHIHRYFGNARRQQLVRDQCRHSDDRHRQRQTRRARS